MSDDTLKLIAYVAGYAGAAYIAFHFITKFW